jgi:hypothetical protein
VAVNETVGSATSCRSSGARLTGGEPRSHPTHGATMKHARLLILTAALAVGAFAQASFADGNKTYPPFASIAQGKKMLNRDEINKLDETKFPALKDLKSHFTDADLDHDGTINQYEYDQFMTNKHD